MDNLTHSLTGVLLARVAMPRHLPRRFWLGVAAANAPDLDLLASLTPAAYLAAHRHWTHAIIAIPLMAAVAAALVWVCDRIWARLRPKGARPRLDPRRAWLAALAPAASHPLLDWTNSYAIRPWLPFDDSWASGDLLFVIDLWVWGALLLAVLAPVICRWSWRTADRTALAALVGLAGYLGWQTDLRDAALAAARQSAGPNVRRVAAFPMPLDPRKRQIYLEADDHLTIGEMRIDRPADLALVEAAWATELGRAYRKFSLFPIEAVEHNGSGWRVTLNDARFVRFGRPGFGCLVEIDADGRVLSSRFKF
jgi:inner membrane protein